LNRTKSLLEVAIVKWTEYEDHYQEASDWLTQTEQVVQTFNKLQDSLEEKKNVLEQFQVIAILTVGYSFCCPIVMLLSKSAKLNSSGYASSYFSNSSIT